MKKTILAVAACLALGGFLFTSCVKNEESAGVKAVRESVAAYTNAEARYKNAEAKQMELSNELTALNLKIENASYDVNLQIALNKAKAELEVEIANYEKAKCQAQVDILKAKLQAERDLLDENNANGRKYINTLSAELAELNTKITLLTNEIYGTSGLGGLWRQYYDADLAWRTLNKDINDGTYTGETKTQKQRELESLDARRNQIAKERDAKLAELTAYKDRLDKITEEINKYIASK